MAPVRSVKRVSTFSSRVTLYEPVAAATSPSETSTLSPSRRRRSSRLSGVKLELEGEQEEQPVQPAWDDSDEQKPAPADLCGPRAGQKRSPRKPKKHVEALDKPHPAPKRWQETYEVIRKQRET